MVSLTTLLTAWSAVLVVVTGCSVVASGIVVTVSAFLGRDSPVGRLVCRPLVVIGDVLEAEKMIVPHEIIMMGCADPIFI